MIIKQENEEKIQIKLNKIIIKILDDMCDEEGLTRSRIITQAIREMRLKKLEEKINNKK